MLSFTIRSLSAKTLNILNGWDGDLLIFNNGEGTGQLLRDERVGN